MEMSLPHDPLPLSSQWSLPLANESTHFQTQKMLHTKHCGNQARRSVNQCSSAKAPTVMTVVLTHYMKLNTIKTISHNIKFDNSCSVRIYCIATYKITNTKETPKQRTLLIQNAMADGRIMFRVPIMSQTNPVHTSTWTTHSFELWMHIQQMERKT